MPPPTPLLAGSPTREQFTGKERDPETGLLVSDFGTAGTVSDAPGLFGGALVNGYNAERIFYGRRKIDQIRATGAGMLVVPCHSCHGQLNNIKAEHGMEELEVKYLWELVADCMVLS